MFRYLFVFLFLLPAMVNAQSVSMEDGINQLQSRWTEIKYQTPEDKQEAAFAALAKQASALSATYPGRAEPLVWEGIILSTYAGAKGGLGALDLVKQAKGRLEQAEKIKPDALNGSVYTSLASLYYQVPGWPLGFGDNDKARELFKKALTLNPDGIDPNYFYGDFLLEEGEYANAVKVLQKALQAAPRPHRESADAGRRIEIQAALKKAREALAE